MEELTFSSFSYVHWCKDNELFLVTFFYFAWGKEKLGELLRSSITLSPCKPGVSKLFARRATCGEMNICGGRVSQKNVLTLIWDSSPRHAPQESKRRSCVATKDIIHTYTTTYIYNVYGRNTTPSFSLLWSVPRARQNFVAGRTLDTPDVNEPWPVTKFKTRCLHIYSTLFLLKTKLFLGMWYALSTHL